MVGTSTAHTLVLQHLFEAGQVAHFNFDNRNPRPGALQNTRNTTPASTKAHIVVVPTICDVQRSATKDGMNDVTLTTTHQTPSPVQCTESKSRVSCRVLEPISRVQPLATVPVGRETPRPPCHSNPRRTPLPRPLLRTHHGATPSSARLQVAGEKTRTSIPHGGHGEGLRLKTRLCVPCRITVVFVTVL